MNKKMSKIINIILIAVLIFSLSKIIITKAVEFSIENRVSKAASNLTKEYINNIEKYNKYIILEGDNINNKLIDVLKENLAFVPANILDNFFENGGEIILTNKDISEEYYTGDVDKPLAGLFDGNENKLYIQASKFSINDAVIHEFGHVLDSLTGWKTIYNKENISAIYEKEKDSFKTYSKDEHYKLNEREYVAQAFVEYILDEKTLKENSPETYAYVKALVETVK